MGNKGLKGQPQTNIRMVLIGRNGVGKSSTGNTILGRPVFEVGKGDVSVSKQQKTPRAKLDRREIMIANTSALYAPDGAAVQLTSELIKIVNAIQPGPHVFMFVIAAGKCTDIEYETLTSLRNVYGGYLLRYGLVVLTNMDSTADQDLKTVEDVLNADKKLKEIASYFDNRVVGLDNTSKDLQQVEKLAEVVTAMLKGNQGASYFTLKMAAEAEAASYADLNNKDDHEVHHIRLHMPKHAKKREVTEIEELFNSMLAIRQCIRIALNTWIEARKHTIEEMDNTAAVLDSPQDPARRTLTGAASFGILNGSVVASSSICTTGRASLALTIVAVSLAITRGVGSTGLGMLDLEKGQKGQLNAMLNVDSFLSRVLLDEVRRLQTRLRETISAISDQTKRKTDIKTLDAIIRQLTLTPQGSVANIDLRKLQDLCKTIANVKLLLGGESISASLPDNTDDDKDAADAADAGDVAELFDVKAAVDAAVNEVQGNKTMVSHKLRVISRALHEDLRDKEAALKVLGRSMMEFYSNQ